MTPIKSATVRVMNSHDYCHFEVVLTADIEHHDEALRFHEREARPKIPDEVAQIDALRKTAQRLVDKAIKQYQIAKERLHKDVGLEKRDYLEEVERIEAIPENERTPEEMAFMKKGRDDAYWASREQVYDYQDDWED